MRIIRFILKDRSRKKNCDEMELEQVDCKVVILGQHYVGKTKLVETFLNGYYEDSKERLTFGAAYATKLTESNNKLVSLDIWDTAGEEKFQAIARLYYRGAKAAVICYDVTKRSSFEKAMFWVQQLRVNEEECKIYLIGTKIDLVESGQKIKEVDVVNASKYAEGIQPSLIIKVIDMLALVGQPILLRDSLRNRIVERGNGDEIQATLIETSSKRNYNVQKVFQAIAHDFTAEKTSETNFHTDPGPTIKVTSSPPPSTRRCCSK